jgi:stearoyl-CoA desaturase (delta-9 desaturase)
MSTALATNPTGSPPLQPVQQPSEPPGRCAAAVSRIITTALVVGPVVAFAAAVRLWAGHGVDVRTLALALAFYVVTAFGVTVGFHRLFTHRSFTAKRPLKIGLAVAGSMAVEGSLIGWVANHRRHHMFSDHPGDPHSPHGFGPDLRGQLRGLFHAHCGWLFTPDTTPTRRFAPDLLRDRDLLAVNRLFPVLAVISLAAPFALGWVLSGTLVGALSALVWAGALRMAALHHVTWSVNSLCHVFGKRPFATKDRSTNLAALALVSLGDSWHNFHHAHPGAARHGALRHQIDPSAALIRVFERSGWATKVRWYEGDTTGCLAVPT